VTYEDAVQALIARDVAVAEILDHDCDPVEFFTDCGDRDSYTGREILNWLGY
jgi:hypothetical protein